MASNSARKNRQKIILFIFGCMTQNDIPLFYHGVMKIQTNDQNQLSLSLPTRPAAKCPSYMRARQRRIRRAGLWFEHMRRIVEQAADRLPAPVRSHEVQQAK